MAVHAMGEGRAHGDRGNKASAIPDPLPSKKKRMCALWAGAGLKWALVSKGLTQLTSQFNGTGARPGFCATLPDGREWKPAVCIKNQGEEARLGGADS